MRRLELMRRVDDELRVEQIDEREFDRDEHLTLAVLASDDESELECGPLAACGISQSVTDGLALPLVELLPRSLVQLDRGVASSSARPRNASYARRHHRVSAGAST